MKYPLSLLLALQLAAAGVVSAAEVRDPWLWPFAGDSIWNMPIGSEAVFVPAGLGPAARVGVDVELLHRSSQSAREQKLFAPKSWETRAGGTQEVGSVRIDDGVVVPDAGKWQTPNNCAALLQPDGRSVRHVGVLCRPVPGGPVFGYPFNPDSDLFGDGIRGSHGGSGLSALGGSIRLGELTGPAPIRHALKVDLLAPKYAFYGEDRKGFRWPATMADRYAKEGYKGKNRAVVMGSLLALPPAVSEAEVTLKTPVGKKLFRALQDYGAYVVDDAAWDCHYLCVEDGVPEEFAQTYGTKLDKSPEVLADINALFTRLAVVDNNAPDRIGGGGWPRAALAPPLGAVPAVPEKGPTPPLLPVAIAIRNGAMTDGDKKPAHWTQEYVSTGKIAVSRDTVTFKSAPAALSVASVEGAAKGQTAQIIEAPAGTRVALAGFVKAGGTARAVVGVQSYTADWKGLQFAALGSATAGGYWQRFAGEVTLPAQTARFGIVLLLEGEGQVWLDDVTSSGAPADAAAPEKPKVEPPPKALNAWSPAEGFYPAYPEAWRKLHENNLARGKKGGIDVLFIGDSLTQGWDKELWEERYAPLGAANFGIGGDGTPQVLWRIAHGELDGLSPKVVVLMIGINNTWPNYSAADTVKGVEAIVAAIRAKLPQTKIALLGVLPIWDKANGIRAKLKAINTGLARLDDGQTLRFLDFGDKMLAPDGSLGEGLYQKDALHLTPPAYRIYADALDPLLKQILQ